MPRFSLRRIVLAFLAGVSLSGPLTLFAADVPSGVQKVRQQIQQQQLKKQEAEAIRKGVDQLNRESGSFDFLEDNCANESNAHI